MNDPAELREVTEMARTTPDHQSLYALLGKYVTSSLGPDGRDNRSEMDQLEAAFPGQVNAVDLFAHLSDLAQEYGPRAGRRDDVVNPSGGAW